MFPSSVSSSPSSSPSNINPQKESSKGYAIALTTIAASALTVGFIYGRRQWASFLKSTLSASNFVLPKVNTAVLQSAEKPMRLSRLLFPINPQFRSEFWGVSSLHSKDGKFEVTKYCQEVIPLVKKVIDEEHFRIKMNARLSSSNLKVTFNHFYSDSFIEKLPKLEMQPADTSEKSFIYVRHGSTDMTKEIFFKEGPQDLSLNLNGLWEVRQAIREIGSRKVTVIATSPSKRTIETAETLSMHFGIPYFVCDELRPRDLGNFLYYRNKLQKIIEAEDRTVPDFYRRIEDKMELILPPNAERMEDFKIRTSEAIKDILNMRNETPIIVGHGSGLRAFTELNHIPNQGEQTDYRKYGTVFELKAQQKKNTNHTSSSSSGGDTNIWFWLYMNELMTEDSIIPPVETAPSSSIGAYT